MGNDLTLGSSITDKCYINQVITRSHANMPVESSSPVPEEIKADDSQIIIEINNEILTFDTLELIRFQQSMLH